MIVDSNQFADNLINEVITRLLIRVLSQGSVAVTFDLWFYQLIGVKDAELQLRAGLKEAEGRGLLIDSNSIQITGNRGHYDVTVRSQIRSDLIGCFQGLSK